MKTAFVSEIQMQKHLKMLIQICTANQSLCLAVKALQPRRHSYYKAIEKEFGVKYLLEKKSSALGLLGQLFLGHSAMLAEVPLDRAIELISSLGEQSIVEVYVLPKSYLESTQVMSESEVQSAAYLRYMVDEDSADRDGFMAEVVEVTNRCPPDIRTQFAMAFEVLA